RHGWESHMPRNRMPGHDGPGNEMPLSQKVALAWVKRWVKQQAKGGVRMNRLMVGRLLKFLGALLTVAGGAVIANDWSAVADWFSQNSTEALAIGSALVATIAGLFIRKKIQGKGSDELGPR